MLGSPDSCSCFGWSLAGLWHTLVLLVLQTADPWQENRVTSSGITLSGIPCQAKRDLSRKICCFSMWGICSPVPQAGIRHHELSSLLVKKQMPNGLKDSKAANVSWILSVVWLGIYCRNSLGLWLWSPMLHCFCVSAQRALHKHPSPEWFLQSGLMSAIALVLPTKHHCAVHSSIPDFHAPIPALCSFTDPLFYMFKVQGFPTLVEIFHKENLFHHLLIY